MSKRVYGSGSVRFDANHNRWRVAISAGRGGDGKRLRVRRDFDKKVEAEAWLRETLRHGGIEAREVRGGGQRLSDWLTSWLTAAEAAGHFEASTLDKYRRHVRVHLTPALGFHRLTELGAPEIQAMVTAKLKGGLSKSTVRDLVSTLSVSLKLAVMQGLLERNPADSDALMGLRGQEPREHHSVVGEDARRFLQVIRGDRVEGMLLLSLTTTMRQGEVLGLPWANLNLSSGRVSVTQALTRKQTVKAPKTRRGNRKELVLPLHLLAVLEANGRRQLEERLAAGPSWQGPADPKAGFVFTTGNGTPWSARNLTRAYKRLLAKAGLSPAIQFRDLRSTCATLLNAAGIDARTRMYMMGHSRPSTTDTYYTDVTPEALQRAATAIDALLWPAEAGAAAS